MNNEETMLLSSFLVGVVVGWIAFGTTTIEECKRIGAFVAGGNAFICEVKK